MRNQTDRSYSGRSRLTLVDLEKQAPGSGTRKAPPADVAAMIAKIGKGPMLAAMEPIGF